MNPDPLQNTSISLDYWKAHVTLHHVLACELSYSLIYDNIRPDKVSTALATVGLTRLPNRFLLIQVDDYYNYSSKMRITQEFFQKTSLINILRSRMNQLGLTGFMANLVGLDKLICFLCCPDWEDENINARLLSVAESFKEVIRTKSAYTISLCISPRCDRLVEYSRMYPKMDLALSKSYFSGKEFSIFLEDVASEPDEEPPEANLNDFYPQLLTAFARCNREQLENVLQEMTRVMLEGQVRPQRSKMELVRMLQRISEYCIQCGVPKGWMQRCSDRAMARILSCNFITDTRICLRDFYDEVVGALEECSAQEQDAFKLPVSEYIAAHYAQPIRLGEVAQIMNFSEGHFARTFRKEFGMTFVQYLTEYRIQRARELLSDTHIPIEQIAYRVGINSYSYFCTCFKRLCGTSPGAYRANRLQHSGQDGERTAPEENQNNEIESSDWE